jgi:ankyrin repeat protein
MTKLLLERGADVNLQGGKFETPLGAAKEGGHLEIVELLVKAGARQP